MSKHYEQEILVAVGLGGSCVLGYEGRHCQPFLLGGDIMGNVYWEDPEELFGSGFPANPDVYLWRGSIELTFEGKDLVDMKADGEFAPAQPEEIARLAGKYDPLPCREDPEDG